MPSSPHLRVALAGTLAAGDQGARATRGQVYFLFLWVICVDGDPLDRPARTVAVYRSRSYERRYGEHGEGWEPLARSLAVGLAAFFPMTTAFFPVLLATPPRRVFLGPDESGQQVNEENRVQR